MYPPGQQYRKQLMIYATAIVFLTAPHYRLVARKRQCNLEYLACARLWIYSGGKQPE